MITCRISPPWFARILTVRSAFILYDQRGEERLQALGNIYLMLKVTGKGSITTCDGITRRDFLQVGALGAIGLTLSKYAALQAMGALAKGNDEKAAIMIFNLGAPSKLDNWDMKPDAPREIRGPFKPIKTKSA